MVFEVIFLYTPILKLTPGYGFIYYLRATNDLNKLESSCPKYATYKKSKPLVLVVHKKKILKYMHLRKFPYFVASEDPTPLYKQI